VRQYAMRRMAFFVPVILAVSMLTFFAVNLVPGDIAAQLLGQGADRETVERFRETHGLNDPLWNRYVRWFGGMLQGDPGKSLMGGNIRDELRARAPVTALIMLFGFTFTMFFGMVFGIIAAVLQDSKVDYFVRTFSVFGLSVPDFFLLTLLMLIPAVLFRYSPPFGYIPFWEDPWRVMKQIVPPTLILSFGNAALLMRLMRSAMLEVLRQDYIRTARSKGLQERVVLMRHALKNAAIPGLTVAGAMIANLLGGSVILENITALPGLGAYTFNAILLTDYHVVMTMVTYAALLVVVSNLVVDLLYAYVDPRIRYG
jgi:peptide/nickel transport system permease protein